MVALPQCCLVRLNSTAASQMYDFLQSCAWRTRWAYHLWSAADGQANGAQQVAETRAASPLSVVGAAIRRVVPVPTEELLPVGTRDELIAPG